MKKNSIKKYIRDFIFIISFVILFFEENIVKFIGFFRYYDEILTAILFIRFIIIFLQNKCKIKKVDKIEIYILLGICLVMVIGLISNYFSKLQSIKYILIDLFSCIEIFLLYCSLKHFKLNTNNIMNILTAFSKFMSIIIFFCGLLNIFFDIGMEYDVRYGIKSFTFIYSNPGTLVIVLVSLLAILDTNFRRNLLYIIMVVVSMLFTLRGLGIVTAGIYIVIRFLLAKENKIGLKQMLILLFISLLIGSSSIYTYFGQDTPRSALLINGVKIANDYFPIGTGFGTYGSDVTKESYTDLYYTYELNKYYGLSENFSAFITDNYWPMIVAQFGWVGFIIVISIIVLIFLDVKKNINNINAGGLYIIIIYIIISSVAAQLLAHYLGVLLFLIIALLEQINQDKSK